MNQLELAEFLPNVPTYIEGVRDFRESIPPDPTMGHPGTWAFGYGPALVMLNIGRNAALTITAGLALGVPFGNDVSHDLNNHNAHTVMVGRLFLKEFEGTGRGTILMQEIVECQYLDGGPSTNLLLRIIARVAAMAGRLSPGRCQVHGGDPPPDEAELVVLSLA